VDWPSIPVWCRLGERWAQPRLPFWRPGSAIFEPR
jgi:hypothetical protein